MTTIVAQSGTDTWVRDDHPNRNMAGTSLIRLQASHRYGFVHIPVTDVRGRTVLSATLTGHVGGAGFAAQTVTVAAVTDSWSAGKTTWNRKPSVGASVSTALGALSVGDAADLDVTALVQSIANGAKPRGFRLATDASTADESNWRGFDSPNPSWTLTIELSDAPEQPSDLRPNIGAVGSAAPILAWSYVDLGGDSSEQGGFRVQVDPDADESSPAFDSGVVVSADPQYDLSSGSFTPLASGASTQWRVQTQDAAGNLSEWSDWATFSYEPYPTLTVDSPTGGVIGDSTPDVIAHLTGETLTQWRVRVLDAAGEVLWNSGLSDGVLEVTVPKRNDDGVRVIRRDDATYTVNIRAWGDVERADAVGLPAYVEQNVDVVFDEDAGVVTPGDFTVAAYAPGDPRTTFTWTRTEAPDAVLITDDGTVYARLDADDWTLDAGTYTWIDNGLAAPNTLHTFKIRAIESGVRSTASTGVAYTPAVEGTWLIPDPAVADPVQIDGVASLDGFATNDRRATYQPVNSDTDVDIVNGQEGLSGALTDGSIEITGDRTAAQVDAAIVALQAIRAAVYDRPQLVFATVSVPVLIRNLTVGPAGGVDGWTPENLLNNVFFAFIQDGD